jgi:hypothetical protein
MDYDPFGQNQFNDLDNLSQFLISLTTTLELVKVVLEQKGFKGTGINVSVAVAPRQVNLIM